MMLKSIDKDEKLKIRPKQSLRLLTNNNEYWFLTEDGLYEVLMQSRKPTEEQNKKY
ncbi:BRO family protein [Vagococcus lutrae]|uniref:BRO family protein n=1 Tax=Vagococcus lutrae TaxID=81947 RepID=UPI0035E06F29